MLSAADAGATGGLVVSPAMSGVFDVPALVVEPLAPFAVLDLRAVGTGAGGGSLRLRNSGMTNAIDIDAIGIRKAG